MNKQIDQGFTICHSIDTLYKGFNIDNSSEKSQKFRVS